MSIANSLPRRVVSLSLLVGVVVAVLLLMAQSAEAAYPPTSSPLQGYDTQNLRWLEYHHPDLYRQIGELPWVADGLIDLEKEIIDYLLYVDSDPFDVSVLEALIPMPFLQASDSTDLLALRSMERLAYAGAITPLLEHAAFLDGISEDETVLVVAAGSTYDDDQFEISRMLHPGYATVEAGASETGVQLSIVRTGSTPQAWTIESLASAVEFVEQIMLDELPVGHVVLLLSNKALGPDDAGVNYGWAIGSSPDYEQDKDSEEGEFLQATLAHEVAHYFWLGNVDWIDEGLAATIELLYAQSIGLADQDIYHACTIQSLEDLSEQEVLTDEDRLCDYRLGADLFLELRGNMTEAEFSQLLGEFYSLTREEQGQELIPGIETVRAAFPNHLGIVDKHWYGEVQVTTGSVVGDLYDVDHSGIIDKAEVIAAINDYLFGEGAEAIGKSDVIEVINLYLFG